MLVLDSVLTWSGALDDRKHDGQAIHWVRRYEKLTSTSRDEVLLTSRSGLAWHTDDQTLRSKFEEFGQVDEAVSMAKPPASQAFVLTSPTRLL